MFCVTKQLPNVFAVVLLGISIDCDGILGVAFVFVGIVVVDVVVIGLAIGIAVADVVVVAFVSFAEVVKILFLAGRENK